MNCRPARRPLRRIILSGFAAGGASFLIVAKKQGLSTGNMGQGDRHFVPQPSCFPLSHHLLRMKYLVEPLRRQESQLHAGFLQGAVFLKCVFGGLRGIFISDIRI